MTDTRSVMVDAHLEKPTALVGFSDEWMLRSMESVFEEKGFQVTRTSAGYDSLRLALQHEFDVLVLDERIDGLGGVEVCAALRDDPNFDHATPIVIISSAHSTLPTRTAAYAAGCWEYCHQPIDVDALFLKLGTFLRARRELAEEQAKSLVDYTSGLYTAVGLRKFGAQLEARAVRNHEPIACLAFSSEQSAGEKIGSGSQSDAAFSDLANLVRSQARRSDVLAKSGESQLAMLAPETDADGARLLVARLERALRAPEGNERLARGFRAGFCAVADLADAGVNIDELVERAASALAVVGEGGHGSVLSFDEVDRPPQL